MRAVLFEGTPEEFARVEAVFRAGGDPALLARSTVLPQSRPKAWPELDAEQCYRLARRVLERAPARLVDALSALAEAQNLSGDQTIEDWADYADRQPDELCGMLAEFARCASRAFIELFGCDNAPQRVKGAAGEKVSGTFSATRMGHVGVPPWTDCIGPILVAGQGSATGDAGALCASLNDAQDRSACLAWPAPGRCCLHRPARPLFERSQAGGVRPCMPTKVRRWR